MRAKAIVISLAFAAFVAILLAAAPSGGSSMKAAAAEGIEGVAFRTSIAGFAMKNRVAHLAEIRRGEAEEFRLELKDESVCRFGRIEPEIELRRQGDTLLASLVEKQGFHPFLVRTGRVTAILTLPRSWRGGLSAVLDDTDLLAEEIEAGAIVVEARDESVEMRRVRARELAIEARDAQVSLDDVAADDGRLKIRDGGVEALDLSGTWVIAGRDGDLSIALAPGFKSVSVESHDACVRFLLPDGAFRFSGSVEDARIFSDFGPIQDRRVDGDSGTRALALEVGIGGPPVSLVSHAGSIELRRR